MNGGKILNMLKSYIDDEAKAEEIYNKIFELTKEIISEEVIKEHSDNYSNNWDLDETQKSISLVSYKRGMNKTLKLLFPNKNLNIKQVKQSVCPICGDTGHYTYGGSFGGATITQQCSCKK